jgi:hypothetical protein
MLTLETTDLKEVRRCRIAQFSGRWRTLAIGGVSFVGVVHSVRESEPQAQPKWIVTISTKPTSQKEMM